MVKDLFSIHGKVALVTGGSRGIGLMIARGFVENGATVYISSRKPDVCDRVAAELSQHGTCVSLPADLREEDEVWIDGCFLGGTSRVWVQANEVRRVR